VSRNGFELAMLQVAANKIVNFFSKHKTVGYCSLIPHIAKFAFSELGFLEVLDFRCESFPYKDYHEDFPHIIKGLLNVDETLPVQVSL